MTFSLLSDIFEGGRQQKPVVQHAGLPPEVHRGESEDTSGRAEQFGFPTPAGVSVSSSVLQLTTLACFLLF